MSSDFDSKVGEMSELAQQNSSLINSIRALEDASKDKDRHIEEIMRTIESKMQIITEKELANSDQRESIETQRIELKKLNEEVSNQSSKITEYKTRNDHLSEDRKQIVVLIDEAKVSSATQAKMQSKLEEAKSSIINGNEYI